MEQGREEATPPAVAFRQFCVLCAKPDELAEVIDIFDQKFESDPKGSLGYGDHVYLVGPSGNQKKLMVTTCEGMGHVSAAVRTAEIMARHLPKVIAFVGTAASLNPGEIQLGDVVIPRKAVFRSYDKISQKGQRDYEDRCGPDFRETFLDDNVLIADLQSATVSAAAQSAIAPLIRRAIALERGEGTKVSFGGREYELRDPKLMVDVDILSCGMVVDSVSYRDFLVKLGFELTRKAHVIDMESFGFFDAVRATSRVESRALMIRGISDYAGRKQQTEQEPRPKGWKEMATRNAAVVAAELFQVLVDRDEGTRPTVSLRVVE